MKEMESKREMKTERKREKEIERRSREEEKEHDTKDEKRTERERPVRAKIVVQRPTRNLLLLHRRTDERTDGRINRGSHLLFTRRALCTRANARGGPLYERDDIGYRRVEDSIGACRSTRDRDRVRSRRVRCKSIFISLMPIFTNVNVVNF